MVTRPSSRRAVALVDAIVAVIILGVSLTVILSLTGQAISSQRVGEELQKAAMYADEQLNLVLARGPDDYAKTYPVSGDCDPLTDGIPETPVYRYKLSIEPQGETAPYQVRCVITWDSSGRERSISVDTLIAARTLVNQLDRQPTEPVERGL